MSETSTVQKRECNMTLTFVVFFKLKTQQTISAPEGYTSGLTKTTNQEKQWAGQCDAFVTTHKHDRQEAPLFLFSITAIVSNFRFCGIFHAKKIYKMQTSNCRTSI